MAQVPSTRAKTCRKILACALRGATAAFAGPVIVAYGGGMVLASVASGLMASTVAKLADNMQQDAIEIQYYPHQAQQVFRDAISQFLQAHLDLIFQVAMMNRSTSFGPTQMVVKLDGNFEALKLATTDRCLLCLEFNVRVVSRPGTTERAATDGIPPPPLPNFADPQATAPYTLPPSLAQSLHSAFDGIGWSAHRGAAIGAVGAVCTPLAPYFWFVETAPGIAGIVVGIPSFTSAAASAVELQTASSPLERVAYCVNFAAELKTHFNRLFACANNNGVNLHYFIKCGIRQETGAGNANETVGDWTELWYEDHSQL
ncbi:hypothetical protein H2198_002821 [Neophaeococcomyces mojaviensis]|uniref:Uncharacterized protein n=1 Tax=Neophaeococcomyces mojaviensis TaxID=3383035 RepID=A0ACC3ACY4_9EURO|nr:hypothetical protein H2198_002821 [Knufia sp. JES_112]